MRTIRHRLFRPRCVWPLAIACGAAVLIYGRFAAREDIPATAPAIRTSMAGTKDSRPAALSPRELLVAWSEASDEIAPALPAVITITGRPSARREEAFRNLLAGMRQANAADLYRLLQSGEPVPNDMEWQAFMEKWGRLDGAGAAASILNSGDVGIPAAGLLGGWASVDPPAAAAWLEARLATGESEVWHIPAQRELIRGWLRADSGGAADWLNDHREDPAYPEIAAAFADEVVAIDPANAMEWAGSVEGPWRKWALDRVGLKWLEINPPAATKALQAAGYDSEAIDRLILSATEGFDLLDPAVPIGEGLPGVSFAEE